MHVSISNDVVLMFLYLQGMTRKAAFKAATTLSLVAPSVVVPKLILHIRRDLDAGKLEDLSETDIAIWRTPEGTLYHDGTFVIKKDYE